MEELKILVDNGIDVNESLRLLGDIDTYKSIMHDFLDSYDSRMSRIRSYKENNDMTNYAIEVHSLKSDSKYLGFTKLAELSLEQEMASKNGDVNTVENNYNLLVEESKRIIDVVRSFLENDNSNDIEETEEKAVDNIINTPSNKPIILTADDSSIIREFITESFNSEYEVIGAKTGREVANIISMYPDRIAILLLDLNMPDVDGFGVLEWFKKNDLFKKIPVTVISGANDKENIDRAFTYPIVDLLNKPFEKKDVINIVKRVISK